MEFNDGGLQLSDMRREIESAFSEFIYKKWRSPVAGGWEPPADVFENDEAYFVTVDLPGVLPNGVHFAVEDHRVILSGSRTTTISFPVERHLLKERNTGSFYRTLYLTTAVDPQKAEMTLEHGVFQIVLPKRSKRFEEDLCGMRVVSIGEESYG